MLSGTVICPSPRLFAAALVFFTLFIHAVQPATAQVTYQITTTPTFVVNTGRAEVVGWARITPINAATTVASTVDFLFEGAPCDNNTTTGIFLNYGGVFGASLSPTASPMTGLASGPSAPGTVRIVAITNTTSGCDVSVTIPQGFNTSGTSADFIELAGVRARVDMSMASTPGVDINVRLNATPSNATLFTTPSTARVATSQDGLIVNVSAGTIALCFGATPVFQAGSVARIEVREGFNGAFVQHVFSQTGTPLPANARPLSGATNNTQIHLNIGALPAGVSLTWPATVNGVSVSGANAGAAVGVLQRIAVTATDVVYEYTTADQGNSDLNTERFRIQPVVAFTQPVSAGTVTGVAHLYPPLIIGDATSLTTNPFGATIVLSGSAVTVNRPRFNDPLDPSPARAIVSVIDCNPVPALTALQPSFALAGGGAFTLTVTGSSFVSGAVVNWNGTPRTTTFISSTELRANIVAADVAAVGTAQVTVTNPQPTTGPSAALTFTIVSQSFSLAATPSSQTAVAGNSSAYTVTISGIGGFASSVNLACSGLPAGASCSFAPNPATPGTVALTVATTSATPVGSSTFTITGTSGGIISTTTATLQVTDFGVSLLPLSQTVTAGSGATYVVTVTGRGGFASAVDLSCTGLPAGAVCSFVPNPAAPGASTLTVSTTASTPAGSANFSVLGASAGQTRSAAATLNVGSFSVAVTPTAGSVFAGGGANFTINITAAGGFTSPVALTCSGLPPGATCAFTPNPAVPGTATLALATTAGTAPGSFTLMIGGTSAALTRTADVAMQIVDFSLAVSPASQSISAGSAATYTVTVSGAGGFASAVDLSCTGLPAGATCSFTPNPALPGTATLSVSTTTAVASGATFTVQGSYGGQTRMSSATLNVTPFSIVATPVSATVVAGSSATFSVSLTGATAPVTLACSGLPAGASCAFSPNPLSAGNSILTVSTTPAASAGTANFTITGTSGALNASTNAAIQVTDYAVAVSPASQSVLAGSAANYTVTITAAGGFASTVALSCTGLPAGSVCTFATNPASPGTVNLTVTTTASAGGTASFSVVGASGGQTRAAPAALNIGSFTLGVANASATVAAGSSATYIINVGAAGAFGSAVTLACSGVPAGAGCSFSASSVTPPAVVTLTVSTSAATPSGSFAVTGTAGSLSQTVSLSLDTAPVRPPIQVTLAPQTQTVAAGATATYTVNLGGDDLRGVTLTCEAGAPGLGCITSVPVGATASLRVATSASTPAGTYTIRVDAQAGLGAGTATAELVVATAGPAVAALPAAVVVSAAPGSNPPSATLRLTQSTATGLAFTAGVEPGPASGWLRVSPPSGNLPADLQVTFLTTSLPSGTHVGRILITAAGASNSPLAIPVEVTVGSPRPVLPAAGITSAASFEEGASAGALVTLFGTNLLRGVTGTITASGLPLPTELAGTFVTVNGVRAPLLAVSSTDGRDQVNLQIPWEAFGAPSLVFLVSNNGTQGEPVTTRNRITHPAVFSAAGAAAVLHADGRPISAAEPAASGEVILVFASGLGPVEPAPPSGAPAGSDPLSRMVLVPIVTVGGVFAPVQFGGLAPGFVALYQLNVQIPVGLPTGQADLIVNVLGPSHAVRIPIR